jgi:hypothetical protein
LWPGCTGRGDGPFFRFRSHCGSSLSCEVPPASTCCRSVFRATWPCDSSSRASSLPSSLQLSRRPRCPLDSCRRRSTGNRRVRCSLAARFLDCQDRLGRMPNGPAAVAAAEAALWRDFVWRTEPRPQPELARRLRREALGRPEPRQRPEPARRLRREALWRPEPRQRPEPARRLRREALWRPKPRQRMERGSRRLRREALWRPEPRPRQEPDSGRLRRACLRSFSASAMPCG